MGGSAKEALENMGIDARFSESEDDGKVMNRPTARLKNKMGKDIKAIGGKDKKGDTAEDPKDAKTTETKDPIVEATAMAGSYLAKLNKECLKLPAEMEVMKCNKGAEPIVETSKELNGESQSLSPQLQAAYASRKINVPDIKKKVSMAEAVLRKIIDARKKNKPWIKGEE